VEDSNGDVNVKPRLPLPDTCSLLGVIVLDEDKRRREGAAPISPWSSLSCGDNDNETLGCLLVTSISSKELRRRLLPDSELRRRVLLPLPVLPALPALPLPVVVDMFAIINRSSQSKIE
jgi:hypothetical protein